MSQTPAPNANGWNNGPVTITWSCADSLSGATAATVRTTVTSDGANQSATATCSDKAGNTASATRTGVNVDRAAPLLAASVSLNPIVLNGSAIATANATDALSGIAAQSCATVNTSTVGVHTVSCTATDQAGNTSTGSATYTVMYGQKLMYNTTSLFKSGTNVPIVVQLLDASGKNISSSTIGVTALAVVNSSGVEVKTINTAFVFGKGQYTYTLNTTGLSSGSYTLTFSAGSDPTTHLAPLNIK